MQMNLKKKQLFVVEAVIYITTVLVGYNIFKLWYYCTRLKGHCNRLDYRVIIIRLLSTYRIQSVDMSLHSNTQLIFQDFFSLRELRFVPIPVTRRLSGDNK